MVNSTTKVQNPTAESTEAPTNASFTGDYIWLTEGEPRLQYKNSQVFVSDGGNVKSELIGNVIDYAYQDYYNNYQPIYQLKGYSTSDYIVVPVSGETDSYVLFRNQNSKDISPSIWQRN